MSQITLGRSSAMVHGVCLDRDTPAHVRFHPAPADTGVVFLRTDLPGEPRVRCSLEHIACLSRWSSLLGEGDVAVHHTEHVLGAIALCQIDNVLVEVGGDSLPVLPGGACLGFVEALRGAGVARCGAPRLAYALRRPVRLEIVEPHPDPLLAIRRSLLAMPADTLSLRYLYHVPWLRDLRVGLAEHDPRNEASVRRLAEARTYYLLPEAAELSGRLSLASRDFIVLSPESPQELVEEVARHKILDLLGDLVPLGHPLLGRVVAMRTGHRSHQAFLRLLHQEDALELVERTS